MDTHFRKLQQDGIGAKVKHTAVISIDEENLLWDQGILGTSNPLALGVTLTQTHLDEAKRESNGSTTRLIWNLISEFFTKEKKSQAISSCYSSRRNMALDRDLLSACISKL